jgi:hypothetical protein
VYRLNDKNVTWQQNFPDGSVIEVIDRERLDQVLGTTFEDEKIRRDGLSITILNTTKTPGLGQKIARRMGRLGFLVVTVANDNHPVKRCQISGQAEMLKKESAVVLQHEWDCQIVPMQTWNAQTDLIVRIGETEEVMYLPPEAG